MPSWLACHPDHSRRPQVFALHRPPRGNCVLGVPQKLYSFLGRGGATEQMSFCRSTAKRIVRSLRLVRSLRRRSDRCHLSWWKEKVNYQLKIDYSRKKKTMGYYITESNGSRDISDKAVLRPFSAPFFFLPLTETTRIYTQTKAVAKSGILCYNLFCRSVPETKSSGES